MSSYSGFSSRKIQDKYNNFLKELFGLLSQIIISQIDSAKIVPFKSTFHKLQNEIKKLDSQKYCEPKFSRVLQPLTEHMQNLDVVKQWHSEPQKKKSRSYVQNNFIRTRNASMDQARRTISFTMPNNQKTPNQKPLLFKQNRYLHEHNLSEKQRQKIHQKLSDNGRGKKIYRSRQISAHLIPAHDIKYNTDHNQTFNNGDNQLSMEELMKKNPLIERKMSAHRKRRLIKFDFPQIREEEEEEGEEIPQYGQESSKFTNEQSYMKFQMGDTKEYYRDGGRQGFEEFEGQQEKEFVRT